MATFSSVKEKIQGLIDKANSITRKGDADLNSGVNSLIEGFGQGGDYSDVDALIGDGEIEIPTDSSILDDAYDKGYTEGIEQGRKAEYDELWDNFQVKGAKPHYSNAFSYTGWNDEIYDPKYPITPTNTEGISAMFSWNQNISDTKVPITAYGKCAAAFNQCVKLKSIPKLIFDRPTTISNMFSNCVALEELNCEGVIDITGLNLQWSKKLSKASITSVINCLSTTTSGLSVTISKTAVNNAFATSEGAADGSTSEEWLNLIATKSNWTISLLDAS